MRAIIIIPSRMASTRLPNKPLAMIGDAPMVVQVWRRAMESGAGEVIVACDGEAIADAVRAAGGKAVVTDPALPSGSDRIWAALMETYGPDAPFDVVINLQGDLPTFDPAQLTRLLVPFEDAGVDVVTLAAPVHTEAEKDAPQVVKAVLGPIADAVAEAKDFVRGRAPTEPMYHHIGVYAYRTAALKRFVSLPPSARETERKLEQMRALDAGMRIACVVVDKAPLGVDTPEDLDVARRVMAGV